MAKTSTLAAQAVIIGDGDSNPINIGPYTITPSPGQKARVNVNSGNNLVATPANTLAMVVMPGQGNSGMGPTIKGSNSDVGIQISDQYPSVISANTVAGTIVVNVAYAGLLPVAWL